MYKRLVTFNTMEHHLRKYALILQVNLFTDVYKTGTETRRWGHWDACVRTCDLGTRDEGLGDIKYGTWGRVGRGRGER